MAQSKMALITFFEGGEPVDPGYGVGGIGGRPDNSLPGYGRPDNSLPRPPGSIGTLPVFPFDPTIDNSLPSQPPVIAPPITLHPGLKLVVKYIACYGFIGVPDNSLPGGSGSIDNTLPDYAQPK